ncbi:hypothetical protein [Devosia neptuniae]|jgi:hypothetical protein|uniref:hypothetical protein n=1 Tax=Devosia TaxID=46913 RepID=UPI0022AECC6E|nr:hypothetical protein [Devosia neptuniae]MCZ4344670.1 hypothetical protein [Devosia neptuniae]|tara:strand:- start:9465 stop:9929 length:465 start_codon:yes stop_codon:yes gene_type:complete
MSLREKNAWIAVGITLAVWSYYFGAFWIEAFAGIVDGAEVLVRFLVCMGISLVVMIGLNVFAGVMSKKNLDAAPDEMELHIEARADRFGFRLLELLVPVGLIGGLLATDTIKAAYPADPGGAVALIFANGVLMAFVITELVRETTHIIAFRMSA